MSLKIKLISCLSALVLVISIMLVAVFAATNVTLNIGGNVSFTATATQATISQGVVSNGTLADSANKMHEIVIDAENDGATAIATWSGLELTFNENGQDMTITFDITNNHTERDLQVSISNTITSSDNATMAITSTSDDPITGIIIPANTTGTANSETITVTFSVTNKAMPASLEGFTIDVDLTSVGEGFTVNLNTTLEHQFNNYVSLYYVVNGTNRYDIEDTYATNPNQSVVLEGVKTIQFFCIGNSAAHNVYEFSGSFSPTIYDEFYVFVEYQQETSSQVFNITQNLTISLSFEYGPNAGGGIIVED